ncbi:MAG: hypothetical protein WBN65_07745 [Gammaproteobacteria bacterium]
MQFNVIGRIEKQQTFATGKAIRELPRRRKIYGRGSWRKRKGIARIGLEDGSVRLLEVIAVAGHDTPQHPL